MNFYQRYISNSPEWKHKRLARIKCRRRARRDGWLFKRNGKVFCPKCSGKKRKPEEE